jgi:hypothetical protein
MAQKYRKNKLALLLSYKIIVIIKMLYLLIYQTHYILLDIDISSDRSTRLKYR